MSKMMLIEKQLKEKEVMLTEMQEVLKQKDTTIKWLQQQHATTTSDTRRGKDLQVNTSRRREKRSPSRKSGPAITFKWMQRTDSPIPITSTSYVNTWDTLQILDSKSHKLYTYRVSSGEWLELPECPQLASSLACINNIITAIGGLENRKCTNKLVSLVGDGTENKWIHYFPSMPTKRSHPVTLCRLNKLLVAGGSSEEGTATAAVEIMNTETKQWFMVTPLPFPIMKGSATVNMDVLYISVYQGEKSKLKKSVMACLINDLTTAGTSTEFLSWYLLEHSQVEPSNLIGQLEGTK